ncbi:uncharacterized protein V5649_004662 [Rhynchonycteris naso]
MLLLPLWRKESSAGEGPQGRPAGGGAGAGSQLREPAGAGAGAAGPNLPWTRLNGGARLRTFNARAPRRVCVSPLSPSFPASPSVRLSSERPPKPQPLGTAPLSAQPRHRALEDRGRGAAAPGIGARVPAQYALESERGAEKPGGTVTAAAGEAAGPARRPP